MEQEIELYGGRYQTLEEIGRSQVAVVHRAYDTRLEREVAIKIILPNRDLSEDFRNTFFLAVKELAGFSHANILKVLDYGSQNGSPYLVMDYVAGGSLQEKIGKPIGWQEAFRLLVPVANSLQYAHERGVIHRDLKPSNILIDAQGQPLVTDFGVVTIIETEETRDATSTTVGLGLPEYMSPEQGSGLQVGASGDIYTLGIILYEMLTGQKPFVADIAMEVVIKQVTTPAPNPRRLVKGLPVDVAQIVMRMLQKKPAERFRSMQDVIDAMERTLRKYSKSGKRKMFTLSLVGIILTVVVAIVLGRILLWPQIQSPTATATLQVVALAPTKTSMPVNQTPTKPAPTSTPGPTPSPVVIPTAVVKRYPALPGTEPLPTETISVAGLDRLVELTRLGGGKIAAIKSLSNGNLLAGTSTGFYYYHPGTFQLTDFFDAKGEITDFDFDQKDMRIAAGYPDGMLRIWDAQSYTLLFEVEAHSPSRITSVRYSSDGEKIVTTGRNNQAVLWDTDEGKQIAVLTGHLLPVTTAGFLPDGTQVITGSEDFRVIFWDANTGVSLRAVACPSVINNLAISPDGKQLAVALRNATVQILDVESGKVLRTLRDPKLVNAVNTLAYTRNGTLLAAGASDGTVRLWNVAKGQVLTTFTLISPETATAQPSDAVTQVLFPADEDHLLVQTAGGALVTWNLSGDYSLDQKINFSIAEVRKVAISAKGQYLAAQFGDQEVRVWNTKSLQMQVFTGAILSGNPFSPDEKQIALALHNNQIRLYDVATASTVFTLQGYPGARSIRYLVDGKILAAAGLRQIRLWSTASGKELLSPNTATISSCQTASDDQNQLIGAGSSIGVFDNQQAASVLCGLSLDPRALAADFLPTGEMVAFGLDNHIALLWKANNGQPQQVTLNSHKGKVRAVAFSPDGTLLATGSEDQAVMIWETATGQFLRSLSGQNGAVLSLQFSSDGNLLLAGSADGALHIWGIKP